MERRGQWENIGTCQNLLFWRSRVQGPRGEHRVCLGNRKRAALEPSTVGLERGGKGQTGLGHMGLQLGEATFCLWWEPPGSFLVGKPREMMWLLFARGPWGQEEVRKIRERPVAWSG